MKASAKRPRKAKRRHRGKPGKTSRPAARAGAGPAPELLRQAVALHQAGRLHDALSLYQQILLARPDHADTLNCCGLATMQLGDMGQAANLFRQAVALAPGFAEAHSNLGLALKDLGETDEAVAACRRALALRPERAGVHYNLGVVSQATGDLAAAAAAYRRAIALEPGYAEAHNNLGSVLQQLEELDAAEASFRRALACRPRHLEALVNLGLTLRLLGRLEEAEAACRRALEIDPRQTDAQWNRAYPLLALGRLKEGWEAYEYRPALAGRAQPPIPARRWQGEPLDGATILVLAEQGIGDEIQFASCLPDLIARAGHCIVQCDPRLEALFARSFPEATVRGGARSDTSWLDALPAADWQVHLASLLRYFRPTIASFPAHDGYLRPDPAARERWARRLAGLGPGLTVGISWRSMRARQGQRGYAPLLDWAPILGRPGVQVVNLQYDEPEAEIAAAEDALGIRIARWTELDLKDDLDGTAALIAALDLVIAPNNATHGLAGALGVPVWTLHLAPSWNMLGTGRHPFFPKARVYLREPAMPDWSAPLTEIARDLDALAEGPPRRAAVG